MLASLEAMSFSALSNEFLADCTRKGWVILSPIHFIYVVSDAVLIAFSRVFLKGGRGYNLSKHVLTPVSEPTNDNETRFNEAHAKIHNIMRTTLGYIKRRFRCLMQLGFAQEGSLDKKSNIIKACFVLHNIAKKFSVPPPPLTGKTEHLHPGKQRSMPTEINPEALKARQELIDAKFTVVSSSKGPQSKGITEEDV